MKMRFNGVIRKLNYIFLLAAALPLLACNATVVPLAAPKDPPPPWRSKLAAAHPLVGRIWQPDQQRYIQPNLVKDMVRQADFILLGEKHDNIDHHVIQAWLVQSAFERGRVAPVAFEMFTTDQNRRLEKYQSENAGNAVGLGPDLNWEKSGWPAWSMYYPIAQAAMSVGAPLIAASLPRKKFRLMVKQGVEAVLGRQTYARLGLGVALPSTILAAKRWEIVQSHCHKLPQSMVDPMVHVQRAKDAKMADVMIESDIKHGGKGALLIAGGGHVRNDYGVPWYLKQRAPHKSILTIGMVEVDRELTDPQQYGDEIGSKKLPFDIVWFTPRLDDKNPCERYAKQLKKLRKKK